MGRLVTMHWGVRAFVFVVVALAGLRARATPPPLHESEIVSQENRQDVQDALEPCGKAATRARVYGVVEIDIVNGRRPTARLGQARFLRATDIACVQRALRRAKLTAYDGRRFVNQPWLRIGEVRPLFTAALVQAWKAAVTERGSASGKLAALLPREIRISSPRCLRFRGPAPIEEALDAWLNKEGRAPASAVAVPSYALPDGWWIRVEEHNLPDDEFAANADEEMCLDRVDVAVSALRRNRLDKGWVEGEDVAFQIEWVVDADGRMVGDFGFCVAPQRRGFSYTFADIEGLRTRIGTRLRAIDYGRRRGYERLVMRYGPDEEMRAESRPATAPLARADSTIESRCDLRSPLGCERNQPSPGYVPIEIDRPALARCVRSWPTGMDDLAVELDVSPDGRVNKVGRSYSRGLRGPSDKRPTVSPSMSSCMQKVLR
ncbi:MAG TPA: hypothetical protein VN903_02885, partial [Polyangia bacterium]|nr:hypothetical protein [Polyangia bacterium]